MRIAHVTPVFPPYAGGIGTVAQEYAAGLLDKGESVSVFAPEYAKQPFTYGNAAFSPRLLWKLRGLDVIHLHYPFYGGAMFAAMASYIWRTPLVVTYHMKTKAHGWLGMIFKLHRWVIEPFILRRAAAVLVSSSDYARSVGLRHNRLFDMPFGVDTDRFHPSEVPKEMFTFLFVGGL